MKKKDIMQNLTLQLQVPWKVYYDKLSKNNLLSNTTDETKFKLCKTWINLGEQHNIHDILVVFGLSR